MSRKTLLVLAGGMALGWLAHDLDWYVAIIGRRMLEWWGVDDD